MIDNDDMLNMGRRGQLTAGVTLLMLKGAGYAAAVVFGAWLLIAVTALIGEALPERSRETPDPIIRSDAVNPSLATAARAA